MKSHFTLSVRFCNHHQHYLLAETDLAGFVADIGCSADILVVLMVAQGVLLKALLLKQGNTT